jgi:electron transport complex protein RnfG
VNGAAQAPSVPRTPAGPMFRTMVGVGVICGLVIVTAYETTRERIAANQAAALSQAILEVLPGAATRRTFALGADGRFTLADAGQRSGARVHAAYDDAGALVGVAVEAQGQGYADTIRVIWGYSPERAALVGMKVLQSKETPGIGDKLEKDAAFLENFRALDLTLDAAGEALAHAVVWVKHGTKRSPWEVDGITGATISSTALADMLNASAAEWVPRIEARRDDFRAEAAR